MSDKLVRGVRALVGPDAGGPTDAELLRRFATTRDAGAFELLVWRHAGLVRAAARAVVRDHHLAEDAAQAAFLLLARKAGSVRDNPAGWLYRVARRAAGRMRRTARRAAVGSAVRNVAAPAGPLSYDADDLAILHAEVAALPDRYRLPVLLCHLEGLSHADAADRLGWPVGTVAGRLSRGRDLLRPRLARRGLAPSLAALAVAGNDGAFAVGTARLAVAFAAGETAGVAPTVLSLVTGVSRAMTLLKLKLVAGAVLACGALSAGVGWAGGQRPGAEGPAGGVAAPEPLPAAPAPPPPKRRAVDANAPNPGKPEDPKREADPAARRADLQKLKQLALAFHNYFAANGHFPRDIVGQDGKPLLSWRVALLPFVEQEQVFRQFKLDQPWDSPDNQPLLKVMPSTYRLLFQRPGAADTYMQAFAGPGTIWDPARRQMKLTDVTDGTSQTLLLMPVGPAVPWTKPQDVSYDPAGPFPQVVWPYANTLPAANADGSCFHLTPKMLERQLRQYIEVADDQPWPRSEFEGLRLEFPADTAAEQAEVRKLMAEAADDFAATAAAVREFLKLADGDAAKLPPLEPVQGTRELARQMRAAAEAELKRRREATKK